MLPGLEIDAVPELEELAQALKVLLLEAVEEDDFGGPLQDLDFEAFGGAAPLRRDDVAAVEREGVAARRGFPAEPVLGESALPRLLGQVEVDAVELLAVGSSKSVPGSGTADGRQYSHGCHCEFACCCDSSS